MRRSNEINEDNIHPITIDGIIVNIFCNKKVKTVVYIKSDPSNLYIINS